MSLTLFFEALEHYLVLHPILAPIVYAGVHILCAVFFIPCSPMAIIAGILWGNTLGLLISVVSAFLASSTTFWLARRFIKNRLYAILSKRYAKTDWFLEQTRKHGWKFVATVQLNPAAPASTLGYLFGLTAIDFWVYAGFAMLFMLPLQFIFVFGGSYLPTLITQHTSWLFIGISLAITIYLLYNFLSKKNSPRSSANQP